MNRRDIADKVEDIFSNEFDDNQRESVNAILDRWISGDDFVFPIVDGPPGTGKTSVGTLATVKYLLENPGGNVAYLCFTHFATDWAWRRLQSFGLSSQHVLRLHYDSARTDWTRGIVGCRADVSDLSRRERNRLKECGALLCTLHGSKRVFSVQRKPKVIVDEFSQVSPAMFFSLLYKCYANNPDGYALLGDPIQLPIITTQPMLRPNIGVYVMQRKAYDPHKLIVQHRMHEGICEAVNAIRTYAYHSHPLKNGEKVRDRDLTALEYSWNESSAPREFRDILDPKNPVVLVNTDELGPEIRNIFGGSISNIPDADYAVRLSLGIYNSFKDRSGRGLVSTILSPYAAQVGEIRQRLPSELKWLPQDPQEPSCTTVYRSQGREYPCVIISFVRNNPAGKIGFLERSELRAQTYVGCSRAQAKLILLLSFKTFIGRGHLDFEALNEAESAVKVDASGRVL